MSDRTPGSVRTSARDGDGEAPEAPRPDGAPAAPPVSATQSIPTSGAVRAQSAAAPAGAPPAPPRTASPVTPVPGGQAPGQTRGGQAPAGQPPAAQVPVGQVSGGQVSGGQVSGGQVSGGQAPGGQARPAGRPSGSAPAGKGKGKAAGRGPRRARLQLRHVDIWSAFKISLVLSIVLFFIWIIAVAILYVVLNSLGVFSTINDLFGQLGSASGQAQGGTQVVSPTVVFIGAAVIGAINVILMTALCTVATFIYNMCADLVGGLEVTLSERD
jgi:Transmembrane domain of unknown function (DUF3566)